MVLHLAARLDSIRLPPVRFDRHFSYLICSVTHTYRSRLREFIRRRGFVVPAILNLYVSPIYHTIPRTLNKKQKWVYAGRSDEFDLASAFI